MPHTPKQGMIQFGKLGCCSAGVLVVPAPPADESVECQDFGVGRVVQASWGKGKINFACNLVDSLMWNGHFRGHSVMPLGSMYPESKELEPVIEVRDFGLLLG
jgi:hypothetical protein